MITRLILATGMFAVFGIAAAEVPPEPQLVPFSSVENPPPIHMLVPGFTVRELPLNLNNINCLACAPDGRIFALGYDGNVFQLKDTDGDGLEDSATLFFDNSKGEILPSIGMAWGPGGLYIASRGRVIKLRDKGDGTSELETVASGWVAPAIAAGSSLDAVGLTVDADGNIYFGLGCDAWSDAYRPDKATGKSNYNLHSDRGTIQRLSSNWGRREAIATGLRFTVSLAFNAAGDLFCTDQEGATWLANGNPFDELLQIRPGRHYGFPPRHPRYLPDVIDEPSVFDFGPQHQSTCGLHFNNPSGGGTNIFGPGWWRDDAIVSGESRGKIWRTKLANTSHGYVAQTELIACLSMLTIDAMPTPQGDLLVTCHSGKPDWGTGPQGKGKLFKISYSGKSAPLPVLAYAASPGELRVTFDRPVDPLQFRSVAKTAVVTMGKYVTAGDRFESFRPDYRAVENQMRVPRYNLPVLSASVTADGRTVALQTAPCVQAVNYAVKLPWVGGSETYDIDVLSDRTGVEARWHDAAEKTNWSGWLPHLDLAVARSLTAASAEHRGLFNLLNTRGELKLSAQLDLWSMLHPMIQPGEKLDYEYPPETVTVILRSDAPLKVSAKSGAKRIDSHQWRITVTSRQNEWLPVEVTLTTGPAAPSLEVSWSTDEDPRERALPLRRILLPWAKPDDSGAVTAAPREIPEIAGGDWERGRQLFFGEPVGCSKCHQVGGQGGKIGPDLSNLLYRDYTSVLRDIQEPSATINPDHIAYNVELKNGESATGVVMEETPASVTLGQVTGKNLVLSRTMIAGMKPSAVSLMPEGLLKGLDPARQKDLLTFLLTAPPAK